MADAASGSIRVGTGGWIFPEWRDNFYPKGLSRKRELEHASRALTAIEINSTFRGGAKPASFAAWRDTAPDGFVFAVKGSMYATHRSVLAEAGESVRRFVHGGLAELGPKLGPIVWQFAPTKRFDADDLEAFLALLPASIDGLALRHVLEVRHASFMDPAYVALARRYRTTTVFTDADDHPSFADLTGELVYARLMRTRATIPSGYPADELAAWAGRARDWATGSDPTDLPRVEQATPAAGPRDVFIFFIQGAKAHNPAAAQALIALLR
jgi:uncharacterized protein YecE (DUF72 family)